MILAGRIYRLVDLAAQKIANRFISGALSLALLCKEMSDKS